ncbi:multidrug resistance efflux pump [Pseudoxanthomonas sp. 3HH-4]|uniref:HlyD family secretion protein n=1 Tax=Pseudoxanthomonas sp. 3HH-4 TaxID=1690214 RepID=UPI001175B6EE|nr:HlyD family secretion protein [Pseudoxanthomonas sp. 3HH-4]TQM12105.1 multidrug resistance efflux pump [Pseudoxanthomonas sp. 3HH-4]
MTEQTDTAAQAPGAKQAPGEAATTPPSADAAARKLRKLIRIAVATMLAMFLLHLVADRITPYTSQAAVDTLLVQITPEVGGPVTAVGVRDNHEVKRGQVLFRIDPLPFEIAARAAEASLAAAVQGRDSSEADVRVADAQLHRQRVDLATTRELGRIVIDLAAKRALSETAAIRANADIAKTSADIMRAEAEAERARIRLGEAGDGNVQVRQALVALEQARLDLRRTTVVAPADGVVTNLRLSAGQYASRGQPVLSFIEKGPRWVTAAMRENQLGNIAPGNRAWVALDDRPGEVFDARVDSIGWGIAQGGETPNGQLPTVSAPTGWLREPQRFPVRIVLDSSPGEEQVLVPARSGAQASVVILTRDRSLMNPLSRLWIRMISLLSFLR